LESFDSYEIFRVIDAIALLDTLEDIKREQRQALLLSLAFSYVNIGRLFAENNLTDKELKQFRMWIQIDKDDLDEFGCYLVNVCYTRNADCCFQGSTLKVIPWKDCDIFPLIKQVQGLSGFVCLKEQIESIDGSRTLYYHFVPQRFDYNTLTVPFI